MDVRQDRAESRNITRTAAQTALAWAKPGSDTGRADAAVALLALWVTSKDEAEFEAALDAAMVLTEDDIEATITLARVGEFHEAAVRLVG